jgi:putative MATE family efflux protein
MQPPPEPTSSSPVATAALDSPETELPGLWRLTWPLFVSLALSLSLNFSDAFFLSRISDAAAGAAGAINPLLGTTLVLFGAVGQAGASVAGRLFGAKRHAELPVTYLALLGFNLATGLVVSALLFSLHSVLPGWLGLRGASAEFGRAYLGVMGSFQVLKAVQIAYANMLNSRGETRWILVEAIATNVTNVTLNLAISSRRFAWLPRPSVTAVASCTAIALAFGMLFTIAVVHLRLKVRFPVRISLVELRQRLRPILRIGLPSATEPIAYQSAQIVINMMVITFGASSLAARTYVSSFITISTILWSFALGVGTQILVAHRIGAARFEEANQGLHRALGLAMAGNLTIALFLAAFHRPLLGLLTHDPEVLRVAAPLFGIAIVVESGRAVNIVAGGALRSTGDARFVAVVGSSMMWCVGVFSAYVLGSLFGFGLTGVWIAMALDETSRGFVNYRRWRAGHWRTLSALAPASH